MIIVVSNYTLVIQYTSAISRGGEIGSLFCTNICIMEYDTNVVDLPNRRNLPDQPWTCPNVLQWSLPINCLSIYLLNDREFWLILLIRDWPRCAFLDRTSEWVHRKCSTTVYSGSLWCHNENAGLRVKGVKPRRPKSALYITGIWSSIFKWIITLNTII